MPQWSNNPLWTNPIYINGGNQYTPADGLTAADLNKLIHNILYLKNHGNGNGNSNEFLSNITTQYISIIPSYDATGPILYYTVNISIPNDSGVVFISPANKDTALQCSKFLQSVQITANNRISFSFNALPTIELLSFRFVLIPTTEGNIVPVFDACWSESSDITTLENDVKTLKQQMEDLLYTDIIIKSFDHNIGIKEYGETINSILLSWEINKTPTTLSLEDIRSGISTDLNVNATTHNLSNLSLTKDYNTSWRLIATGIKGDRAEKTTSVTFFNGVYYGAASIPNTYDSAFILGLTKELRESKKPSFTVTAGEGQYIYYCLPVRMGTCTFAVGGFTGGFSLVDTIDFTNASGYTESYYIYRSDNADLGATSVNVS